MIFFLKGLLHLRKPDSSLSGLYNSVRQYHLKSYLRCQNVGSTILTDGHETTFTLEISRIEFILLF